MKAIIIAAGMGRRLAPYTDEMPKCLVPVAGKPIMRWQMDALRACGIDEFVIVRGYLGDVLERLVDELGPGDIRFVDNTEFGSNNILLSLFCADAEIEGPLVLTYSDIVFTDDVVRALMKSDGDISLVIDRDFADIYEGRTEHPLDEAEVSDLDERHLVKRVGKRALPAAEAWGEFIGLMRLTAQGTRWLRDAWTSLCAEYQGRHDQPFERANEFRNAYLTDILQHLIGAGRPVSPVEIRGQWREIDTVQDLHRAHALLQSGEEDWK